MDEMPKRNRNKENPYFLKSDRKNDIYILSFSNDTGDIDIEITKELFDVLDELERIEANLIQQDKRHLETDLYKFLKINDEDFDSEEIFEIILYRKSKEKPKSMEDKIIENFENEILQRAIDSLPEMYRRRILLYYKHNLSVSQIAKIERCSKVAVKYSIDSALEELKKILSKKI